MALSKQGFEDERFETAVAQSLHCSICENVFKQPVMCRRNQHLFCHSCITDHLNNSRTCPLCRDELTAETLSEAPRVLTDTLSELKIRCDYFRRGCREIMQLGDLERHVKDCGFAAVVCSNEGCLAEINKRDRIHHETEVCEFRKVQCHNCAETRAELGEVKIRLGQLAEVRNEMGQLKLSIEEMKVSQDGIKKRLDQLATLEGQMLGIQTAQEKMIKELQAIKTGTAKVKHNVVVAGGECENSVERLNLEKRFWTPQQPLKKSRGEASSFLYNNQLVVAGGRTEGSQTDDMEAMNIDSVPCSTPWLGFPVKLHSKTRGHKSVVHNDRLITVGGYDGNTVTDSIHEVQLVPPYTSKLLTKMTEPRVSHGAELCNDKIFIAGGCQTFDYGTAMASTLMYDIDNNKGKQMAPLLFPVCEMSTVSWGDNVIIIGGADAHGKALDTVAIYNVKTEKSHMLPSMKCKRKGCTAVVAGNIIVVMGGKNEEGHKLSSVEEFNFNRYSWKDLPPMNKERWFATAAVVF